MLTVENGHPVIHRGTTKIPGQRTYFAQRLVATRRAFGAKIGDPKLTARLFAELLGMRPGSYGRYERGELEPNIEILTLLRRVTGVSLDRLVAGEAAGDDNMISAFGIAPGETEILADRLKKVRQLAIKTAKEAAELMQVTYAEWLAWEHGATRPPLDKLHEFATRARVTVDYLLTGDLATISDETIRELLKKPPVPNNPSPYRVRTTHTGMADIDRTEEEGAAAPWRSFY